MILVECQRFVCETGFIKNRFFFHLGDSRPAAAAKLTLLNFVFKLSNTSFLADYPVADRDEK